MKNNLKRVLSLVLAFAMVFTYVPTTAFAEGVTDESTAPALPSATVTSIKNDDLTFALNFKADTATEEQKEYYGDWYADYVLTVNKDVTFNANGGKDGYLSGQYDAWSENWVSVPFEDVTLEANEPLKIMEYAAEAMNQSGLNITYNDVLTSVEDFDCGVFFEPAFLTANPGLEVRLELRIYNNEDKNESYRIGKEYVYTLDDVAPNLPKATVTEIENDDLTFALNFKADEVTPEQLAYYGDWYADYVLTVNKDVTFNANGGEDGYLSGQYDAWSENWVNVPFEDVTLEAGKSLKIMEYAAEAMNQSGLKVTYNDVVTSVKDFDCGVFFEEEFLAENTDLKVTLELRMYNPADESESYVIGKTYEFTIPAPERPTATVTKIKNDDLTFALNFKADEPTAMQLAYYGDWYADYVLTVNKDVTFNANGGEDGYLSGQYDAWSENWVSVPFEDVTLKAGKSLKIMEYAAEAMNQSGLKLTYNDVVEFVKDFDCGVFFEPAFLMENQDIEVTLELRMYNPENAEENYKIGETYVYTLDDVAPKLPTATVTEIKNDDLTFALNFKADEVTAEQLAYYGDWYADYVLTVSEDVTFNANSNTADGYLSGQYDAWSENWVSVPFEDVTLEAGKSLKIMEYAANLMGQPGLKYTYGEVYEYVKDFDCGVFFTEKYLEEHPELVVTLELRMYNPDDETESYIIGNRYVFTIGDVTPDLPTATVTEIENDDLTFALNFKADEVTPEQLAYYGGWYADYAFTINKDVTFNADGSEDGYLSGQYEAWSENWVNVPFEDVTLKAGETFKIMEYASELMGKPGLKYTYEEVYNFVKDFDCGVFFTEEFLKANPDLEVTLELRMYNPADESESYVVGETYVFTLAKAGYVAYNTRTEKVYETIAAAFAETEIEAGDTIQILGDVKESLVMVPEFITLDLDGYTLTSTYVASFGDVVDNSEENTGILAVSPKAFMAQPDNDQVPVKTEKGYMFAELLGENRALLEVTGDETAVKFVFQPLVESTAHKSLIGGAASSGVNVVVKATWKNAAGEERTQNFEYADTTVKNVIESYKPATGKYSRQFYLTLRNIVGNENINDLQFEVYLVSTTGAQVKYQAPVTTEETTLTGATASAVVPAGVKVDGEKLALTVSDVSNSESNVTLGENEEQKSVDIHIDGVAADNTVPMTITLKEFAEKGLNEGNIALYHVEKGETNAMTRVAALADVDAHNEFYYDPATGDVTMALATFSEVALVADTENAWNGEFDYSWYTNAVAPLAEDEEDYVIANADQLAAFGAIVGGMAEGIERDSFAGKTVKLIADINLGYGVENHPYTIFYPIGYYNSTGSYEKTSGGSVTSSVSSFKGTFDGNGHTISNFYQNTWEMFGDYNDGYSGTPNHYKDAMGLFGYVVGGTVKNLTVDNFSSDGEYTPTGVIAAYADGNSTFENIAITKCNPRVYNTGNGGIIGIAGDTSAANDDHITLKNITVDNSNKISALWGSWDVACGGLVGMYRGNVDSNGIATGDTISFENCHVSAQIDVNNDVCANYQYYAYRYSGMIIGSVRHNTTNDEGRTVPNMKGISATGCTVHFGDWNDYYYCELVANTLASYTHDHQFSRLTEIKAIDGTTITYLDGKTGTVPASGRYNYVVVKGDHATENATCYHFVDGKVWNHEDAGKEIVNGNEVLKEDNQHIYLEFNNLFTGYGWGVTTKAITDYNQDQIKILDREVAESVEKFKSNVTELSNNTEIKLGEIFEFVDKGVEIKDEAVTVGITNLEDTAAAEGEDGIVSVEFNNNAENWEDCTVTFKGVGLIELTIQDYYFCTPTTIYVTITEKVAAEKFEVAFDHDDATEGNQNYVDTYLYRVGNKNTVSLSSLFELAKGVETEGTVDVTIETVNGASGTCTANTSDWTKSTIQFSGTGVVKVTIKDEDTYCIPTELMLEVVDAVNATSATSAKENNIVLLNNMSFSTIEVSNGYTLYGNGFTMTSANDIKHSSMNSAYVSLNNGTLDNVQIKTPDFSYAILFNKNIDEAGNKGTQVGDSYGNVRSAVIMDGNSSILNSYVSGGRSAVYARSGNLLIENSTIEGGAAANIHVISPQKLTLRDITLLQEPKKATVNDTTKTVMGFSVLVECPNGGSIAPIVLEGELKQYAWAHEGFKQYVPDSGKSYINAVLSAGEDFMHDITYSGGNTEKSLNLGFAYVWPEGGTPKNSPSTMKNDSDAQNYEFVLVKGMAWIYSCKNSSDTSKPTTFEPTTQSAISPTVSYLDTNADRIFETKFDTSDNRWESTLTVNLDNGNYEFDFDKLLAQKYGKDLSYTVKNGESIVDTSKAISLTTSVVTDYVLIVEDGDIKHTVYFTLTATKTSIPEPEIVDTTGGTPLLVVKSKDSDWSCAIPALEGIKVKYYTTATNNVILDLATLTPTSTGKQNGTNNYWETTNGYKLKVTCGYIHDTKKVYGMPVVVNNNGNKMYFTISSTNGYVSTGTAARAVTLTYEFTDPNGKTLTFTKNYNVNRSEYINGGAKQYSYSDFVKGTLKEASGGGCVTPDTLITLADGTQKEIQYVTYEDDLLVWDFYTGRYTVARPSIVMNHGYGTYEIVTVNFDDGTTVDTINGHGFYDADINKFVTLTASNVDEYVGHTFIKQSGNGYTTVKLADYSIREEYTESWSVLTAGHYNCVLEDMWTLTPAEVEGTPEYLMPFEVDENLTYNAEAMKADIEEYGLYTYEEFAGYMTEEQFNALNLAIFKVSVGKGYITYNDILKLIEIHIG